MLTDRPIWFNGQSFTEQSDDMAMNPPSLLVTGDVVIDIHLYGGVKTDATSLDGPGTKLVERQGGAVLTLDLVRAASASAARQVWQQTQAERKKNGVAPEPAEKCPELSYEVALGLDVEALGDPTPRPDPDAQSAHPRSYGVWTPHPKGEKEKGTVWRVSSNFGYGEFDPAIVGARLRVRGKELNATARIVLIDDGGVQFRHHAAQDGWPDLDTASHVVLKMSRPVCRGDFWQELLRKCADRLTVLVSAEDLRRDDAYISRRISWEKTAQDTIGTLKTHPLFRELATAKDVVVTFQSEGALWAHRDGAGPRYWLVFDPEKMEGEFARAFAGSVYGFQTCMLAALGHYLTVVKEDSQSSGKSNESGQSQSEAKSEQADFEHRMLKGIAAGLVTRQALLKLGHGQVAGDATPGFPIEELGDAIAHDPKGFVSVEVTESSQLNDARSGSWSILEAQQHASSTTEPFLGLGILVARYGIKALSQTPSVKLGPLISVDRQEIESLRALKRIIEEYEAQKVQHKPLSLAVFGPPGAGKSFAVKAIARAVLLDNAPVLEFNLSQFSEPRELIGAFHQVRDAVLKGITPVVFWDEFDSREYFWLQYLLAPMQDGAFQEDRITHPIGKCIFVFAGGTSPTLEAFGPTEPQLLHEDARVQLDEVKRKEREKQEDRWSKFKLLKGPDFSSRLHGNLNVLGPNPRDPDAVGQNESGPDRTYPVRRALMLRAILKLTDDATLHIDSGLLFALLGVSRYRHGARSLEKLLSALRSGSDGQINRSALPPAPMLDRDVDAREFLELMNARNEFKTSPDIEKLAAAEHKNYLDESAAKKRHVDGEYAKPYDELPSDGKASNRAAAMRITELLELINYKVVVDAGVPSMDWRGPLERAIGAHIERLAQAEHLLWEDERRANGWIYGKDRDNREKIHPLLVDWVHLDEEQKEKDRESVRFIPQILHLAGYRAVPVESQAVGASPATPVLAKK